MKQLHELSSVSSHDRVIQLNEQGPIKLAIDDHGNVVLVCPSVEMPPELIRSIEKHLSQRDAREALDFISDQTVVSMFRDSIH